ncbi:MAG: ATP-binding protein [Rhodomicrobiaceae bacterium]
MHRLEKLYIQIPSLRPQSAGAYLLAGGLAVAAVGSRLLLDPYLVGAQYITFFPAIIITALVSGFSAGLFCTFLCVIGAWIVVIPPQWTLQVAEWQQMSGLVLFTLIALTDVLFVSALRFAISRYKELSARLEERVEERSRELVATQQMLSQSQKMEALGQLTGGLAHDFNNMIAVVVGNLDIMRRRLANGQAEVSTYLENATEGARKAAQLTQRLLAFARHQPLDPDIIDVNDLVSGVSELLRRTLGERVSLECVRSGGLWRAEIDAAQLENAIVNLAVNARDAMPEGGALTIETANAYLDDEYAARHEEVVAGQYVLVAVTDTGTGMTPEVLARAIDPFFTTKPAGSGTGLGLSQVFGFMKQSRGHIAIYSEVGRGTTVKLYLPRARTQANPRSVTEQPKAEVALSIGSSDPAILVVEDQDQVRRISVTSLRELGYDVYEASNGVEALELLDSVQRIGLLFTDVVMPGMDGRQLAEAATKKRPDLKVLYTTGYTRNAIVHDGTLDPDTYLIVKPFTIDQLAQKVRSILEHDPEADRAAPRSRISS